PRASKTQPMTLPNKAGWWRGQMESGAVRAHSKTLSRISKRLTKFREVLERLRVAPLWIAFNRSVLLTIIGSCFLVRSATADTNLPPRIMREFRGAWIATVGNLNWPSKPGLTTDQQKAELLAIFDNAVDLKLNAILF